MNIIEPRANTFSKGLSPYELIERVGRTCYKSEDKIEEGSAEKFIKGLMNRKHYAMIEHSNVILQVTKETYNVIKSTLDFTYLHLSHDTYFYVVSGSFRAWRDLIIKSFEERDPTLSLYSGNELFAVLLWYLYKEYPLIFEDVKSMVYGDYDLPDFSHIVEKTMRIIDEVTVERMFMEKENIMEHIIHTVHFVCDRGVSHEFVRHRNCAFAQESTRYCNYNNDKFGNEITVIEPCYLAGEGYSRWEVACRQAEQAYFDLFNWGCTAQEARSVLPNSLKTELSITCTEKEWQHIINLRYLGTTGVPHPQMKEVMSLVVEELIYDSNERLVGGKVDE